jgi:RNA polymerase sigma-70 factor (ECF subfamily)
MPAGAIEQTFRPRDDELVEALRTGDERAFLGLVRELHAGMVRFARGFVGSEAVAEEVAQDAWAAVLGGLDGFEGRSALRSWIYGILANLARSRAARESRVVPLSSLERDDDAQPAVDPGEFLPASHPRWGGHWAKWPEPWPEAELLQRETLGHIRDAIERLPQTQRSVLLLRDVEGWSSQEVCEALGVSEVNQRVLLHRARSRVRREIARHVERRTP